MAPDRILLDMNRFLKKNVTPYEGDGSFLAGPTEKTKKLWAKCEELFAEEATNGGVLRLDAFTQLDLLSHGPGYIDAELDNLVVGLQADSPLLQTKKMGGAYKVVKTVLREKDNSATPSGKKGVPSDLERAFRKYRQTHSDGVFNVYSEEMLKARKSGLLMGQPDSFSRGRLVGDYRRVALYGIDTLLEAKRLDLARIGKRMEYDEETMRLLEELVQQIEALQELKEMAESYGLDISESATNAKEAVQWVYLGYLGAVKQQDGIATSLGRIDAFLDIYFERDLQAGTITETEAQELIDHLMIKLQMIRHQRHGIESVYTGNPSWITITLGGCRREGEGHFVTKTAFRIIRSLISHLGPTMEPTLAVLWSENTPVPFKLFCCEASLKSRNLQYLNDDIMNRNQQLMDDLVIGGGPAAMACGKQLILYGGHINLPKLLLFVLNMGKDEKTEAQVGPMFAMVGHGQLVLDDILKRLEMGFEWVARLYVNYVNLTHAMHDKYR
eukprot:8635881-Pyramimonas_sp.AAC.1